MSLPNMPKKPKAAISKSKRSKPSTSTPPPISQPSFIESLAALDDDSVRRTNEWVDKGSLENRRNSMDAGLSISASFGRKNKTFAPDFQIKSKGQFSFADKSPASSLASSHASTPRFMNRPSGMGTSGMGGSFAPSKKHFGRNVVTKIDYKTRRETSAFVDTMDDIYNYVEPSTFEKACRWLHKYGWEPIEFVVKNTYAWFGILAWVLISLLLIFQVIGLVDLRYLFGIFEYKNCVDICGFEMWTNLDNQTVYQRVQCTDSTTEPAPVDLPTDTTADTFVKNPSSQTTPDESLSTSKEPIDLETTANIQEFLATIDESFVEDFLTNETTQKTAETQSLTTQTSAILDKESPSTSQSTTHFTSSKTDDVLLTTTTVPASKKQIKHIMDQTIAVVSDDEIAESVPSVKDTDATAKQNLASMSSDKNSDSLILEADTIITNLVTEEQMTSELKRILDENHADIEIPDDSDGDTYVYTY